MAYSAAASTVLFEPGKIEVDNLIRRIRLSQDKLAAIEPVKKIALDSMSKLKVRAYALDQIRRVAETYRLSSLNVFFLDIIENVDDLDPDGLLRRDAFLQHSRLRVSQEEEPDQQVAILIELLTVQLEGKWMMRVRRWAALELCGRGEDRELERIESTLRAYRSSTVDAEMELCRRKIELVKEAPDRLTALRRVLELREPASAVGGLLKWAIEELGRMPGEEADEVLLRFALGKKEDLPREAISGQQRSLKELVRRGWSAERLLAAGCDPMDAHIAGAVSERTGAAGPDTFEER